MIKWIENVKGKQPENFQNVVVCNISIEEELNPLMAYYEEKSGEFIPLNLGVIGPLKGTHWIPIPDMPKKEKS